MSQQWISPRERRGIIVMMILLIVSILGMMIYRHSLSRKADAYYESCRREADSLDAVNRSYPQCVQIDSTPAYDTLPVSVKKPRKKANKRSETRNSSKTSKTLPSRSPRTEPLN